MQQQYIQALTSQVEHDGRIRAAWLEGSFGRGNDDRYSDLDLHMLLDHAELPAFKAGLEGWLADLRPLVLYSLLFSDTMANAMTQDGLRLDVWLHGGASVALDPGKARVLFQAGDVITYQRLDRPDDPAAVASLLLRQTREFWRCIALAPTVLGRDELLVSFQGLGIETSILADVLISGYGIARESGVKRLNAFLPDDLRPAVEDAVSMQGLSRAGLAAANLKLARIMREHGPIIAATHGYAYPAELESAVLEYVRKEFLVLGLDAERTS